jgi:hypothetical protein
MMFAFRDARVVGPQRPAVNAVSPSQRVLMLSRSFRHTGGNDSCSCSWAHARVIARLGGDSTESFFEVGLAHGGAVVHGLVEGSSLPGVPLGGLAGR